VNVPKYGWFPIAGILLLAATIASKRVLPETLGHSSVFIWSCGALASSLFAAGLASSLRVVFGSPRRPWTAFSYVLINVMAVAYLFGAQVAEYFVFAKVQEALHRSSIEMVPKLVEQARDASSEDKRILMAQRAFQYCGLSITYRRDDGTYVEYYPTDADRTFWNSYDSQQRKNSQLESAIVGGQLRQIPYTLAINASCLLISFLASVCWISLYLPSILRTDAGDS
jgi:hypothetical protein